MDKMTELYLKKIDTVSLEMFYEKYGEFIPYDEDFDVNLEMVIDYFEIDKTDMTYDRLFGIYEVLDNIIDTVGSLECILGKKFKEYIIDLYREEV